MEANKYYDFVLEKDGRRYNVNARIIRSNNTIYPDIKTLWLELPYSVAKQLSNAKVVKMTEYIYAS